MSFNNIENKKVINYSRKSSTGKILKINEYFSTRCCFFFQYSIHINQQYRICFMWTPSDPDKVEIIDYH